MKNRLIYPVLLLLVLSAVSCTKEDSVTVIGKAKQFRFNVELARTEQEREKGLMYRSSLKPGSGMLFIFEKPQQLTFWMKNTYIPLTILFIDENYIITDIYDMFPLIEKLYPSTKPCKYALEINQKIVNGEAKPGDKVEFQLQR